MQWFVNLKVFEVPAKQSSAPYQISVAKNKYPSSVENSQRDCGFGQRKWCRDSRCSPQGNPACRGTFGCRMKGVRYRVSLHDGTWANSSWLWLRNHHISSYPRVLSLSFSAGKTFLFPKLDWMSSRLWSLLWLLLGDLLAPLTPHSALFIHKGSTAVFSVHFNQWKCETQTLYALSKVTQLDNSRVKNEPRSPGY